MKRGFLSKADKWLNDKAAIVAPTIFLAIATGLGYALETFKVEALLGSLLPPALAADPNVLLVIIVTA